MRQAAPLLTDHSAGRDDRRRKARRHRHSPIVPSAAYLWLLFLVLFTILEPDTFFTDTTFRLVFSEGVVTATLALAFLVPLAANTYDLTIGANLGLSLVLTNYLGLHSAGGRTPGRSTR